MACNLKLISQSASALKIELDFFSKLQLPCPDYVFVRKDVWMAESKVPYLTGLIIRKMGYSLTVKTTN